MTLSTRDAIRSLAGMNANLFVALAALLETCSVTRSAELLGVSQSAMSQTLRQLREHFDDRLLERVGNRMHMTPLALRLAPRLHESMSSLSELIQATSVFDPRESQTTFRIAVRTQFGPALASSLLPRWRSTYSGLSLALVRYPEDGLLMPLETREVDLAIAVDPALNPSLGRKLLFEEQFCVVMRKGHPLEGPRAKLAMRDYLGAAHGLISTTGQGLGAVDVELARRGTKRRIVLRMASFLGAPLVCANSELIVTCPRRLADFLCAQTTNLCQRELPFRSPRFEVWMVWHASRDDDELSFLREQVEQVWG